MKYSKVSELFQTSNKQFNLDTELNYQVDS